MSGTGVPINLQNFTKIDETVFELSQKLYFGLILTLPPQLGGRPGVVTVNWQQWFSLRI